ncbi:MAG: SDR family NAD(P)-dependent oxidoreductase [Herminiimonas sp.]|nr:SDR family NAD(P)-dependent oxidoreductase [Herminiimonas sp.]
MPHLKPGAAIINTGPATGLFGNKNVFDYSTTKGSIHTFTKLLATNHSERGIRINLVAPGPAWYCQSWVALNATDCVTRRFFSHRTILAA